MTKLKIGDLVVCNEQAKNHDITLPGTVWEVRDIINSDRITLVRRAGRDEEQDTYLVNVNTVNLLPVQKGTEIKPKNGQSRWVVIGPGFQNTSNDMSIHIQSLKKPDPDFILPEVQAISVLDLSGYDIIHAGLWRKEISVEDDRELL